MTDFPSIEELVAPHLERFRALAEAKRNAPVGQVELSFRTKPRYHHVCAQVHYDGDRSEIHGADTVDEAIAGCVAKLRHTPSEADLYAAIGVTP